MELPTLRIVPLSRTHLHEQTLDKAARRIGDVIAHSGVQRNPVIAAEAGGEYIVIDGMHRVAALRRIGCRAVVACLVDYASPSIELKGWYVALYEMDKGAMCRTIERAGPELAARELPTSEAQAWLRERRASFGVLARGERAARVYAPKGAFDLERFIETDQAVLKAVQDGGTRYRLVGDDPVEAILGADPRCQVLLLRPVYRKGEVVERALADRLFPPKSTRHIIPGRPLRLEIPLSILRSDLSVEQMNAILREEIRYRWKSQRIRHYPEAVYVYDD